MANKITETVKSLAKQGFDSVKATVSTVTSWRFGTASASGAGMSSIQNPTQLMDLTNRGSGLATSGQKINYAAKVGEIWKNQSVVTAMAWVRRNFPDARIGVATMQDEAVDLTHPMALLLARPNPYYSYSTLCAGLTFSYIAAGDAYLLKERNGYKEVVELYYRPHWMLKPVREPGSNNFVDYYLYKPDAQTPVQKIDPKDVVHLRNGIDPENELCGMSDLKRLLLTVYTEQESNRFLAAILTNLGIPGVIFTHKPPVIDEQEGTLGHLTKDRADSIKAQYEERFTGDNVARAMVLDGEFGVNFPTVAVDADLIEKAKDISQADIAAAIGIPPVVLGWHVGLRTASAKASHEDSRKQAYRECLMPMQRAMAEDLDIQLLPDFADNTKFRTAFDYRRVATLSEDTSALVERAATILTSGIGTRGEARKMVGFQATDADNIYISNAAKPGEGTGSKKSPKANPATAGDQSDD